MIPEIRIDSYEGIANDHVLRHMITCAITNFRTREEASYVAECVTAERVAGDDPGDVVFTFNVEGMRTVVRFKSEVFLQFIASLKLKGSF